MILKSLSLALANPGISGFLKIVSWISNWSLSATCLKLFLISDNFVHHRPVFLPFTMLISLRHFLSYSSQKSRSQLFLVSFSHHIQAINSVLTTLPSKHILNYSYCSLAIPSKFSIFFISWTVAVVALLVFLFSLLLAVRAIFKTQIRSGHLPVQKPSSGFPSCLK